MVDHSCKNVVQVIYDNIYTFQQDNIQDSIWAWGFVGAEGEGTPFDSLSGDSRERGHFLWETREVRTLRDGRGFLQEESF